MEITKHHSVSYQVARATLVLMIALCSFVSTDILAYEQSDGLDGGSQFNRSKVEYYQKDNITNQVPYFDNRFRLDENIDEIVLIFYRKSGSKPIILIRPDGSKIRVNNFDIEKISWFDDSTYDMIKIKKPMPGPWQAVGDILPNSQILVVSDIKIAVEPLPTIAFSGETLKVEGKLFNGEERITSPHFQHVVHLDVNFYSTNNSKYENFGADAIKVTSFRDDGRGLDEYRNDNTFTGEFVLDFAPGEWQPVYLVKLPMATRELRQTSIILQKTPVTISVTASEDENTPHELLLTIDPTYADPDSFVFQGKFTFPDRQVEPFSIMETTGLTRTAPITNTEPGVYRVSVNAFGKTIDGREFRLVVPEFSFNVEEKDVIGEVSADLAMSEDAVSIADDLLLKAEQETAKALAEQQKHQEEKDQETLLIIILGNCIILTIAVVVFLLTRKKKVKKNK